MIVKILIKLLDLNNKTLYLDANLIDLMVEDRDCTKIFLNKSIDDKNVIYVQDAMNYITSEICSRQTLHLNNR